MSAHPASTPAASTPAASGHAPSTHALDKRSSASRCLLSNGSLGVMLDAGGAGYTRWRGMAVTRWREDPVSDPWGSYLLLRDEDSGAVWSASAQPHGLVLPDDAVAFAPGLARFSRRHHSLHSVLDVAVAPQADIELRRLTLSNHGDRTRSLSLTAYAELVLGPIGGDDAHPAFSKMFVQTEWLADAGVLLSTRRRRDPAEPAIWAAHALQLEGQPGVVTREFDSDRASFLGRGNTLASAQAMQPHAALAGHAGCVLDPVVGLRQRFTLAPGASVCLLLWTRLSATRDDALALRMQLADADAAARLCAEAAAHADDELQALGIDAAQAARFNRWMDALLVSDPVQRAAPAAIARGRGGAPTLWAAGISGDRPIVLLRVTDAAALATVQQLLRAQTFWRGRQFAVDVVLLNAAATTDADALQAALDPLVQAQQAALKDTRHAQRAVWMGAVAQQAESEGASPAPKAELFALRDDAIDDGLRDGLFTVARVVLGRPADTGAGAAPPVAAPAPTAPICASAPAAPPADDDDAALEFANGLGGFCEAGRAYRIVLDDARRTPAPWINVLANPDFGSIVSAEGGGYTWSLNSQQNPLTPWPNDPVSDAPNECIYLRDEDTGVLWSATALPIRVPGARYRCTHGKGWTRFDGDAHGIALELLQCVPVRNSVKLMRLRLVNRSTRTRRLAVSGYVAWALGANGSTPAPFVVSARDEATGALFARNRWRPDFGERVAFFDMGGAQQSITGDRAEFLGPLGAVDRPAALVAGTPLSGRVGAGLSPCGALQARIELPTGTQIELRFVLGDAASEAAAQALVAAYRTADVDAVLAELAAQWNGLLDAVQVRTPDRATDILLNDWLLYQVTACRLWARTAYYQASGAYGFRDQLQDVMALCASRPELARAHLLCAAGRQFAEGDVQHWWLPPGGQGIRTRISDDRIWLAHVAAHYVAVSGDRAVLDETLPFLAGQAIPDGASDAFFQPSVSDEQATVYEHAARALDSALTRGAHGLPLFGTGDWNDGMNAVGAQGHGESSWLGWFLLATLDAFTPLAEQRGHGARVSRWREYAEKLRAALEQAWDGAWYRRGYYDDGAPLGSHESSACQIDTIAQSWSVLAGTADRAHAAQAMASVDRLLVDRAHGIAKLFTPPFDGSDAHADEHNPGYISGYPPGVRENGGQYTHGATWSIFAWAGLGDGDRAGALFDLLNPIRHSDSPAAVERYKVEPYVVSADVYSQPPYVGRGGWTWYSGSAAWLYRAGLEALLGFHLRGDSLRIEPCIPRHWPGFELTYRHRGKRHPVTRYEIKVENPERVCRGVVGVELDGQPLAADQPVALVDDGATHRLRIVLG